MISDMRTTAIHIAGALILTICLSASCRKELPARAEGGEPVTVTATISDAPDTKVTYTEDGNKLKSAWAAGDHIVGWDEDGNKLELEIASADRIASDGTAIFTTVTGSANLPASGNIYMIYAPGMHYSDVGTKTLTVDLSSQSEGVIPALMMATGTVTDRRISLSFSNEMSIVMVKNPKFAEAPNTLFGGLVLSGTNVNTSVKFEMVSNSLTMTPSAPGSIIKSGSFTTDSDGQPVSDVTFYFAVPPTSVQTEVSVSSLVPDGYSFYLQDRSFAKNKCYKIETPASGRFEYKITTKSYVGGTFTTDPASRSVWGHEVSITPQPAQYWELVPGSISVCEDESLAGLALLSNTFTMPQRDVTVDGIFRKIKYLLSAANATNGVFTFKDTATDEEILTNTYIDWDTNVTVVTTPDAYYLVDEVKYNDGTDDHPVTLDSSSEYKFEMPTANTTVYVTFKKQSFTITEAETSNGTFFVSATSSQWGETITVTATPGDHYIVDQMTYTDEAGIAQTITFNTSNVGTFIMPKKNTTVNVTFKKQSFTITKAATSNGTFTVSATSSQWDETITVTATPNSGYIVDKMTYTDESGTAKTITFNTSNVGTFTMPKADTQVNVTFKIQVPGTTPDYPIIPW